MLVALTLLEAVETVLWRCSFLLWQQAACMHMVPAAAAYMTVLLVSRDYELRGSSRSV